MTVRRTDPATSRMLARLLVGGIAVGAILLIAGGIRCALELEGGLAAGIGVGTTGLGVTGIDGPSLLRLGVLVMILTPIFRVVALAILFVTGDDRTALVWAISVLLLLALAMLLDVRH